jgi:hypothetical protein
MSEDYPAFESPAGIRRIDPEQWTRDEARAYFEWLRGAAPCRAEVFLRAIGLAWEVPSHEFVERVSSQWEQKLAEPQFRTPFEGLRSRYRPPPSIKMVLTPLGEAFCTDAGLVFGLLLLGSDSRLYWKIADDPKYIDFNRPVIAGFSRGMQCEPVTVGNNLAGRIIDGRQRCPGREFAATFDHWLSLIPHPEDG